ncbi:MAG: bilirubin oxidase [Alkalinema sp. CACIAM 70d]|nr:MAG: bilirubin oxidase [Alkalinema sp. CACIAM 70d]
MLMTRLISRRRFILTTGGFALGGGLHQLLTSCTQTVSHSSPPSSTNLISAIRNPDVEIDLKAVVDRVKILPGQSTPVWTYQARLVKGDAANLQVLPNSYLGPIIRVRQGQRVKIHFENALPGNQPSIIHWHGLIVPEAMDGHPQQAIDPGGHYTYEFDVVNPAGSNWFHAHPHHLTGEQVYRGLAGLFLVTDEEESKLNLPSGDYDLPIVLQDRSFDRQNQLLYLGFQNRAQQGRPGMPGMMPGMGPMMNRGRNPNAGMGGMMGQMMGFLGDKILVNGYWNEPLNVATRIYRLRVFNASNARIYKLAWSHGEPLIAIATDGHLLPKPIQRPYIMLAPGERVDLWADFSKLKVGTEVFLNSLEFSGAETLGMGGMMPGMQGMNRNVPEMGTAMPLLKIRVDRQEKESLTLPKVLTQASRLTPSEAVNANNPRRIKISNSGMQWLLNDRTFEMDAVAEDEIVKLNTIEQWSIINTPTPSLNRSPNQPFRMNARGMAHSMAHPIHIHGVQFQVIDRQVLPTGQTDWQTVKAGYIDDGWKDTVMVMPGEQVNLLMKFTHYSGRSMYHCHNLEHEDGGMMRNYQITA